jgi:hypothetical protein
MARIPVGSASRRDTLMIGVPIMAVGTLVLTWLILRLAAPHGSGTLRWRVAILLALIVAGLGVRGALRQGPGEPRNAAPPMATGQLPRQMQRHHWHLLTHRQTPGGALEDLIIGPAGVFHVATRDMTGPSKLRANRDGRLMLGRSEVTYVAQAVYQTADAAAKALAPAFGRPVLVIPVMIATGAAAPRATVSAAGVTILPAKRLPRWLLSQPAIHSPEEADWLASLADQHLPVKA